MKAAALAWLVVLIAMGAILAVRVYRGIDLQTDMTALLPVQERDPVADRAKRRVSALLAGRLLVLIGDTDRSQARSAGTALADALSGSGMTTSVTYQLPADAWREIGKMYFPYRYGLLAQGDRELLLQNRGQEIVDRAMASIYAPTSPIDLQLLQHDPFLLLPEFLSHLPKPVAAFTPDEGILSLQEGNVTWVMLVAQLNGNAYAGAYQDRFISLFDGTCRRIVARTPNVEILRLGAIFYAHAGAGSATTEAKRLSVVSTIGTILLILIVFRALRPLWLTLLAIASGVIFAFAVCLSLFGGVHAVVLLFGVGLNGIAVDYCWQYVTARFAPDVLTPRDRLRQVFPGIALGAGTTLIGYATLLFAPFPGLIQLAVFSTVGLVGSFLTIVLWLPYLDSSLPLRHGERMLAAVDYLWSFWQHPRLTPMRLGLFALLGGAAILGAMRLKLNNDVRHQQTLDAGLHALELRVRHLTQIPTRTQFLFVQGTNRDAVLQREEVLEAKLASAGNQRALGGIQSTAQFVPSIVRQHQNRDLVTKRLMAPFLGAYLKRLGMAGGVQTGDNATTYLTPDAIRSDSPLAFVKDLMIEIGDGEAVGLVLLPEDEQSDAIKRITDSIPGVHFVDAPAEISQLLDKYYRRAMILVAISVILMMPLVIWRYGMLGGVTVAVPPVIAVIATPLLLGAVGMDFTFFGAMGLVLVLSIGFDYAVFCREAGGVLRTVAMLGISLALATTLLSFGLMALSATFAVRSFGATLLVGTTLAFLLSPIASDSVSSRVSSMER